MLFSLLALILVVVLLAILLADEKKRESAGIAAWMAAGLFSLCEFVVALSSIERSPEFSNDEILVLSSKAEQSGDFEKAIDLNRQLKIDFLVI